MKQLVEDLISMMEYHVEQTRPIHTTTVALQAAREALKSLSAQPAPVQEPVAIEHCLWARNGNTPCPHTAPPAEMPFIPDGLTPDDGESPEYTAGWNDCRSILLRCK